MHFITGNHVNPAFLFDNEPESIDLSEINDFKRIALEVEKSLRTINLDS